MRSASCSCCSARCRCTASTSSRRSSGSTLRSSAPRSPTSWRPPRSWCAHARARAPLPLRRARRQSCSCAPAHVAPSAGFVVAALRAYCLYLAARDAPHVPPLFLLCPPGRARHPGVGDRRRRPRCADAARAAAAGARGGRRWRRHCRRGRGHGAVEPRPAGALPAAQLRLPAARVVGCLKEGCRHSSTAARAGQGRGQSGPRHRRGRRRASAPAPQRAAPRRRLPPLPHIPI
jgi:hypothetical protein